MSQEFIVVIGSDRDSSYCNLIEYNQAAIDDIVNVFDGDMDLYLDYLGYENFQYIVTRDIVMHDDIYTYQLKFKALVKHDFPRKKEDR